ncbi:tyrosine/phenylalanine carboxypeptidase domain-containing protein [Nannocystaceae bacterium ST9]
MDRHARVIDLDRRLIDLMGKVRVLGALSWPEHMVARFLADWQAGSPRLPDIVHAPLPDDDACEQLEALAREADRSDPLQRFLAKTADSFAIAAHMLRERGTPGFVARSTALYGQPSDMMPGSAISHLEAARLLIETSAELAAAGVVHDDDVCLMPEYVADEIRKRVHPVLGDDTPEFEIDMQLASKAAASAKRVRLRGGTCFSRPDIYQLTQHEALVHSLTAINGRKQPLLGCLGAGSPRTTLAQEGLATVAELTTGSMDITRLRRIALRIWATHIALEGADFIEVFRFFLEHGQTEQESAHSAARVFRGGDVRGRIVFTKDVVYLCGMVAVHTFLHKAIAEARPELIRRVFAGRLALSDLLDLAPCFESGEVAEPTYLPPWAEDLDRLAAYLAFSTVINRINLNAIDLDEFLSRGSSPT